MKAAIRFVLILSLVTSAMPAKAAQQADSAWARVQVVDKWTSVEILDRKGATYRGRFDEADEVSVVIREGALMTRLNRADVLEIATSGRKGSGAAAAGGVAIGFLLNALGAPALLVLPVSAGLPVGLGLAGYFAGQKKPRVIYRAPLTD